tara:strand:+ start:456 stop:704 length:249 start_codon:yes stop_codon:yes gene_type:complete
MFFPLNVLTFSPPPSMPTEEGAYKQWRPFAFSALSAIPPILLAFATQDVDQLVSITGAYGGVGIQWLIPVILLMKSREYVNS